MTKQRFMEPTMWPQAYLISQIIAQVQVFYHSLLGSGQVQPEDYACPNKRIVFHELCYQCLSHTFCFSTIFHYHFVSLCTASDLMPGKHVNLLDPNLIYKVTQKYNDSLKFDPSEPKMAFTTRDPVRNGKSFISK